MKNCEVLERPLPKEVEQALRRIEHEMSGVPSVERPPTSRPISQQLRDAAIVFASHPRHRR